MPSITLRSKLSQNAFIVLEAAVFLGLAVWITRHYLADRWGRTTVIPNLERAVRLEPQNSDYHLRLGRQLQYNILEINSGAALTHLKSATELNPHDPAPWLELSAAYSFQGNVTDAEACLRRADLLAPNLPNIQWVIGNFFLLQGNNDEAFRHFRVVLAGSSEYNRILYKTAWKATDDGPKILDQLIPSRVNTELDYLYFLLGEKRFPEAQAVWKRIAASRETFALASVAGFFDQLVVAHLLAEATQVWNDVRVRGLLRPTYEPSAQNLLINGDFEEDITNMGFDWRIATVEGVHAGIDGGNFHSPSHALLINFMGRANLDYRGAYQFVRVEPGRSYRLQGFLKTEGITTDSGPRFLLRDAYDAAALQKFSESVVGTTGGWTQVILDFTTGPKTELMSVGVARFPSAKLDNLVAGKVWVDDVRVTPVP